MPDIRIGYGSNCKLCNHPRRAEMELLVKEQGMSMRGLQRKLTAEGYSISVPSVCKHFREHFDVKTVAKEQYEESKDNAKKLADKRVSDMEKLDQIIDSEYEMHQGVINWVNKLVGKIKRPEDISTMKIPKSFTTLLATSAAEIRQNIRQKYELLGEGDGGGDLAEILAAAWEMMESAKTSKYNRDSSEANE